MTARIMLAVAWLACTLSPVATAAQQQPPGAKAVPEDAELARGEYYMLVESYLEGDPTAPERVLEWTPARLGKVMGVIHPPGPDDAPWNAKRFQAAAMLHTDGALLRIDARKGDAVPMHLEVASRLLMKGAPDTNEFARRWYQAIARLFRERGWLRHAELLLELGRTRLHGDPVVLCESGTLQEYMAADPVLPRTADRPTFVTDWPLTETFDRARRTRLRSAAQWLDEAARSGSTDAFCQLHQARVWSLLGEDAKADALLARLQNDADDALSYLASMFLGGAAERRGDRAAAERHYREALGRFAPGQSAQVALSTLLMASGRTAEAREIMGLALDDQPNNRREPWWWYHSEAKVVTDARVEELRRDVRR
jgi:tetratricopeptide (TPR) repeat protein